MHQLRINNLSESISRKIIKLARSSAITLPPDFMSKNNLNNGDSVIVRYALGILTVEPYEKEQRGTIIRDRRELLQHTDVSHAWVEDATNP